MPLITDTTRLGGLALFQGLNQQQLQTLAVQLHRRTFQAGTTFINAEEPGEVIYFIAKGAVKVFIDDADGNEVILAFLIAGDAIGEMSLVDCAARSANVIALETTEVFWMERGSFRECLRSMPEIQDNLMRLLCRRLRLANERIQSLAVQDVEGRVARQLLSFAELYGQPSVNGDILIPFRLTQSDLANLIGATRVRVNQVIAAYKQRGYISVNQHYHITISNRDALARRARQTVNAVSRPASKIGLAQVFPVLQA